MDKTSTPYPTSLKKNIRAPKTGPALTTLATLRQFARTYRCIAGMGMCLN